MNKDQKKGKKRKDRAKKSHAKVLKIREAIRKERKEELRKIYLEKSLQPKKKPFVHDREKQLEDEELKNEKIKEQLHKNQKLLEELEKQYDAEQALRKQVNDRLESEGNITLKEKLNAMHQQAIESQEQFNNPDEQAKIDLAK